MGGAGSLIALLGTLIFVCSSGLLNMLDYWVNAPEYSHAALVPVVVAFLIWQQKEALAITPFNGSWTGPVLIAIAGVLYVVGELGSVFYLVDIGFVLAVNGIVLSLLGRRAFRFIFMPLLMLVLMVPLPAFLNNNLSSTLQLWSSNIGVWVIRLFGISVYQEGNVIDLGGFRLQVVEACAGLRYLFPLITLGVIIAYFYKGAMWKRVWIVLSAVPLTIFMNSLRIGIIGVLVDRYGSSMAEGFLHDFEGWVVFMLCAAVMLGEVVVLTRIGREAGTWRQLFGIEFPPPAPKGVEVRTQRMGPPLVASAVVVGLLALFAALVPHRAEAIPVRASLVDFPNPLGGMQGRRSALEPIYLDTLKLDDYLLADYVDAGSPAADPASVNLYVAYYASQRKGESVHSPRSCLPGGGWVMRDFGQRTLPGITASGQPLRVNRALVELGNQRAIVYYWFQERGRIINNEFSVKAYLFWDALTRNRTDGALVRLMVSLPPGAEEAVGDARLAEFARLSAPLLPRFIPD
jgi:exosortase D (VPLPA-CTERM-specific)